MNIGETIRKYRKEKNMTQEQVAERLGVTAPAVNKWERGNSFPDIMMLSPIARLLGVSLDTLLSHQKELSDKEADEMIVELNEITRREGTQSAYVWLKEKMELYPNSYALCVKGTLVFDAARMIGNSMQTEECDAFVTANYMRGLSACESELWEIAADSLFSFYIRKESYEKAEECLTYFPKEHPDLKRKQAILYKETNRKEEACKLLEELLFENFSKTTYLFNFLFGIALEEKDLEKAEYFAGKQKALAILFEMGRYHGASAGLELAVCKKDAEKTMDLMEDLLESTHTIYDFSRSRLYSHMKFREPEPKFMENLKTDLLAQFCDAESFAWLKDNKRWQRLKNQKIH